MDHALRLPSDTPRSVAVFRALQLGDMLCAVPALRALRAALPAARITLVGLPWAREFAARYPAYIDEFIDFPGYPGLPEQAPEVERIPAFLSLMQARAFDLVLQLHGSGRITNPLALLFGGHQTAGFYAPGEFCPDDETFLPYEDDGPERQRLLRLLEFIGAPAQGDELDFRVSATDHHELNAVAGCAALADDSYVCIHPGARHPVRRWAPARFADAADALAQQGVQIVLTGTEQERPVTEQVARAMHAPALNLAGQTNLGALAALLASSRLLVCNDTGVSHLADALRIPSVVVFTGSEPERWAPADRALHRVLRGIGIDVEAVLREAEALLTTEAVHAA